MMQRPFLRLQKKEIVAKEYIKIIKEKIRAVASNGDTRCLVDLTNPKFVLHKDITKNTNYDYLVQYIKQTQ